MFFFPLQRALLEDRGAPRIPPRPPTARQSQGCLRALGVTTCGVWPVQGLGEVPMSILGRWASGPATSGLDFRRPWSAVPPWRSRRRAPGCSTLEPVGPEGVPGCLPQVPLSGTAAPTMVVEVSCYKGAGVVTVRMFWPPGQPQGTGWVQDCPPHRVRGREGQVWRGCRRGRRRGRGAGERGGGGRQRTEGGRGGAWWPPTGRLCLQALCPNTLTYTYPNPSQPVPFKICSRMRIWHLPPHTGLSPSIGTPDHSFLWRVPAS